MRFVKRKLQKPTGTGYVASVLRMMMQFPQLYSSEFHAQEELFCSSNYTWDKKNKDVILSYKDNDPEPNDLALESLLGLGCRKNETIVNYHNILKYRIDSFLCIHGLSTWPPLSFGLDSNCVLVQFTTNEDMNPALDWLEAIEDFCGDVKKLTPDLFNQINVAQSIYHYGKDNSHAKDQIERRNSEYKKVYEFMEFVQLKLDEQRILRRDEQIEWMNLKRKIEHQSQATIDKMDAEDDEYRRTH